MLWKIAVCSFFYAFEMKEGTKENDMDVGLDYRVVKKIPCFLEGGFPDFKGVLT